MNGINKGNENPMSRYNLRRVPDGSDARQEKLLKILRIAIDYKPRHANGNVLSQTSMDINLFISIYLI
jgi:hypothetical protein